MPESNPGFTAKTKEVLADVINFAWEHGFDDEEKGIGHMREQAVNTLTEAHLAHVRREKRELLEEIEPLVVDGVPNLLRLYLKNKLAMLDEENEG